MTASTWASISPPGALVRASPGGIRDRAPMESRPASAIASWRTLLSAPRARHAHRAFAPRPRRHLSATRVWWLDANPPRLRIPASRDPLLGDGLRSLGQGRPLSDVPCRRNGHPDTRSIEHHRLPTRGCRNSWLRAMRSRSLARSLRTPPVVHPSRPGAGRLLDSSPNPLRLKRPRTVRRQKPTPEHLASYPCPLRRRRSSGPRDSSCALVVHDLHTPFTVVPASRTPMH